MRTMLRGAVACLLVLLVAMQARAQGPELPTSGRRVALVVGEGAYQHNNRLASSRLDAQVIADILKAAGFTIVTGGPVVDVTKAQFERAIATFGREAEGAEAAVFYYSGHGTAYDEQNWMSPIDEEPGRVQDLPLRAISVDVVLRQMEAAHSKFNLVILDACRPNAMHPAPVHATATGGLGLMHAPTGTVIVFAAQPGGYSRDGGEGHNSAYTEQLASVMRTPGLELLHMLNRAALATQEASGGEQQPWLNMSPLASEFYLFPRDGQTPQVEVPPPAPPRQVATTDPSFSLLNLSGVRIEDVRASLRNERNWGPNRISNGTLDPGSRIEVQLSTGGTCQTDVRVTLGTQLVRTPPLSTCGIDTLVILPDGRVEPSNADFSLVNLTGRRVAKLYASLTSDNSWGDNQLPAPLAAGATLPIHVSRGMGCAVDVKVEFDDGTTMERRKIRGCGLGRWELR